MDLNIIHVGDCIDLLADINKFPNESVDGVITSPPYFQQRDYNGAGIGSETQSSDYLAALLVVFGHLHRVTKPSGTIVINLGDKVLNGSLQLLPYQFALAVMNAYKVRLINEVTWVKHNPTPRHDDTRLIRATEPFFIFAKSSGYYFNKDAYQSTRDRIGRGKPTSTKYGQKYRRDIDNAAQLSEPEKAAAHLALDAAIEDVKNNIITGIRMKLRGVHAFAYGGREGGRNSAIKREGFTIIRLSDKELKRDVIEETVETISGNGHPAVYPVNLIEEIIHLLVPVQGVILDPFMGSGTTAIAALNTERNFLGIEINEHYKTNADERIAKHFTTWEKDIAE